MFHIHKRKRGIIVDIIIQFAGAESKTGNGSVGMSSFEFIGNDIVLDQIYNSITDHFGVNSEILMIVETLQNGIRNGSDPHL